MPHIGRRDETSIQSDMDTQRRCRQIEPQQLHQISHLSEVDIQLGPCEEAQWEMEDMC